MSRPDITSYENDLYFSEPYICPTCEPWLEALEKIATFAQETELDGADGARWTWKDIALKQAEIAQSAIKGDNMQTPETIVSHATDYKDRAWEQYTIQELGNFVHLLVKRAGHRADAAKKTKDLYDAQNYLNMIQEHVNASK